MSGTQYPRVNVRCFGGSIDRPDRANFRAVGARDAGIPPVNKPPRYLMWDEKYDAVFRSNRLGCAADAWPFPAGRGETDGGALGGAGPPTCGPLLRREATTCYVSFSGRIVVTESMSGFLGPEEQAAARELNVERRADAAPDESLAVLRALAATGPMSIAALLPKIHARPRLIIAILEDLERADRVRIRQTEFDEIVELTDSGRRQSAL